MKKTAKNMMKTAKKESGRKNMPEEWLYMAQQEISLRQIGELLGQDKSIDTELWEEAGVLELTLPDGNPFDMETAEIYPEDEQTAAFVKEHQVKTVFLVTFRQDSYEHAEQVFRRLINAAGGFFCADTEDFTPRFE